MERRDIVVIGASAGGVQALASLVSGLPHDLAAAVFIVLHMPPFAKSRLPEILSRAGPLPAAHAVNDEPIVPGRIYIAPPDRHLLVRPGYVEVSRGPRENRSRPAVDPLFRSAARAYGSRVAGVILSGALYDGSAGLMAVKLRGGLAIVQDPQEAVVDSMPRSALDLVDVDYVAGVGDIAATLDRLSRVPATKGGNAPMADEQERREVVIAEDFREQAHDERAEETTVYTCPDCGGVLWQDRSGPHLHFRCHVGHAYGPEILLGLKSEELEAALWSSIRLLREKATLSRQLAAKSRLTGNLVLAERGDDQAAVDEQHADAIRDLLEAMPSMVDVDNAAKPMAAALATVSDETSARGTRARA